MNKVRLNSLVWPALNLIILFLIFFYSHGATYALNSSVVWEIEFQTQDFEVTGIILDGNGMPLPGTTILEKGTNNGVQSDIDGNFTLHVSDQDAVLVVSFMGFVTQEVPVNGQSIVEIRL